MRRYVNLGLNFFFKEIHVEGLENIPKNKALLFVSGHRNGMIDPILISTVNQFIYYYLTLIRLKKMKKYLKIVPLFLRKKKQ